MPTIITRGAASAKGLGFGGSGGSAQQITYIEDVFSTYLYSSSYPASPITITNGVDLSTKGGLVWLKCRTHDLGATSNVLVDTDSGATKFISTNSSSALQTDAQSLTSFNTNGFSIGTMTSVNAGYGDYVSWSFCKKAKFFDVVTYTGNGTNRTIAHSLGSTPGFIIVKNKTQSGSWYAYSNGLTSASYFVNVDSQSPESLDATIWNGTAPTSSVFSIGTNLAVNTTGNTYVAYLFASNAGGFGTTGTDNVITCGSFTENYANNITVNLGYEPQYVLFKGIDAASSWYVVDNMRGIPTPKSGSATGNYISTVLQANSSAAEISANAISLTPTGFIWYQDGRLTNTARWIYIAVRRGPMKTPTSGTSVYTPVTWTATGAPATVTGFNFPVDLIWHGQRTAIYGVSNVTSWDRLRGARAELYTGATDAESTRNGVTAFDQMTSVGVSYPSAIGEVNYPSGNTEIFWGMRRAPGFFDEVCYTGNSVSGRTVTHNLGAAPELIIVKERSSVSAVVGWPVWCLNGHPVSTNNNWWVALNLTNAADLYNGFWTSAGPSPTSTTFTVGSDTDVNENGSTYVAYVFASLSGVSKVGTYLGTGSTQTINCGFPSGVRFVLIKCTSAVGDWYVYDTARGMVSGTDPYMFLNGIAAETNVNSVYSVATGFQVLAAAAVNGSGAKYIYLAIA